MIPDISSFAKIENIPAALRGDYGTPLEMSKYIDFHEPGSSKDYDGRLYISNGALIFDNTSTSYQLASIRDVPNTNDFAKAQELTGALFAAYRMATVQPLSFFDKSGTFTAPENRYYLVVAVGGGGGVSNSSVSWAPSNAPGGSRTAGYYYLQAGTQVSVVVGRAGNNDADDDRGKGGQTRFGSYLTANGGEAGGFNDNRSKPDGFNYGLLTYTGKNEGYGSGGYTTRVSSNSASEHSPSGGALAIY